MCKKCSKENKENCIKNLYKVVKITKYNDNVLFQGISQIMVDLGGYVIILVETKDKKIKLYGKLYVCVICNTKRNDDYKLREAHYCCILKSLFMAINCFNLYGNLICT